MCVLQNHSETDPEQTLLLLKTRGEDDYLLEAACVHISQDNNSWEFIGKANSEDLAVTHTFNEFDLNTTNLTWAQYVKVVDATNADVHNNQADGFEPDVQQDPSMSSSQEGSTPTGTSGEGSTEEQSTDYEDDTARTQETASVPGLTGFVGAVCDGVPAGVGVLVALLMLLGLLGAGYVLMRKQYFSLIFLYSSFFRLYMKPLTQQELTDALKKLPDWQAHEDHLVTAFEFEDFLAAMDFVGVVAEIAEQYQHHPRIIIEYNVVQLEMNTHDADNQITEKDIDLAHAIEQLEESEHLD